MEMDPWPTQRKEPKAPDKNIEAFSNKDSNIIMKLKQDSAFSNCGKNERMMTASKDSSVSSLNEPDLKALLEEAMAYKRPKDIQGKSDLFKELLHSVESEKKYNVLSRTEKQGNRKPRRKQMSKKELEKPASEGSLQDLIVQVKDCDTPSKRPVKYSVKSSNIPQVVPVNAVNVCDENNPEVASLVENGNFESIEQIQEYIAKEANIYQVKEPVDSRVGFPLTISPYVEKNLEEVEPPTTTARITVKDIATLTGPPRETADSLLTKETSLQETKKSLDENGNAVATSSRLDSLAERKAKARRLKAKNDKNIILSQHIEGHRSDIAQDIDALMKYIESPKLNHAKSSRQRNCSGLTKQNSRIGHKMTPVRDKSSDTFSRKESKSKDTLQKSTSLEEVSISKFEDLTQESSGDNNKVAVNKSLCVKNSWEYSVTSAKDVHNSHIIDVPATSQNDKCDVELIDNDFLPVTKKNRKKKTLYETSLRNKSGKISESFHSDKVFNSYITKSHELDRFHSGPREFSRRKSISSVPSSDKSGDTSDMDSVHSFPVSSSKGKGNKVNVSVSTGSTPQISYADIARSVPSPSRVKCDLTPYQLSKAIADHFEANEDTILASQEPVPVTVIIQIPQKEVQNKLDTLSKEYPPLDIKTKENISTPNDMFVEYTMVVPKRNPENSVSNSINVEETVLIEMPSSTTENQMPDSECSETLDNQGTKPPPVILMNSIANESNDVNDLVFGFEVNQQLLTIANSGTLKKSDIVCNEIADQVSETVKSVDQECSDSACHKNLDSCEETTSLQKEEGRNHHFETVEYIATEWHNVLAELSKEGDLSMNYFSP